MLDLEKIRRDTPASSAVIHLNNAGTSLPPKQVLDSVITYLQHEANIGGYEMAEDQAAQLQGIYTSVSRLINASPNEVALLESATAAWHRAFYAMNFKNGDRILTAHSEYTANFLPLLQVSQRTGAIIDIIPDNEFGELDVVALEKMITEKTRLIAITWIPSNGGLVNPAAKVGEIAKRHNIPYLLDACQAIGQLQIDVNEIGCDMLSATGRKFLRAPRGTGFLYVRNSFAEHLEPATIDQVSGYLSAPNQYKFHDGARRFESFEHSPALRLGLGVAADYALAIGSKEIEARCRHLGAYLRKGLADIDGIKVYDLGQNPAALVTFNIDGIAPEIAQQRLKEAKINVSICGTASTPLDSDARKLPVMLRASPHYYNTEDELDRTIAMCRTIRG